MKTQLILATLLTCFTLGACDNSDTIDASEFDNEAAVATPATELRAESQLKFDTTAIERHPPAALPRAPLTTRAFTVENVARSLLATSEGLKEASRTDARTLYESANWHAEIGTQGQVLAVFQPELGEGKLQDERQLQADALGRLQKFGVPPDEMGPVVLRQALSLDEQDGKLAETPEIDGYKTFVMRGLNGVRVRGHRAVLTHGAEGSFRRVMMRWPAIAAKGHKLRSALSTEEIVSRATRQLVSEGVVRGEVKLGWMYAPTTSETGEVTLELQVIASLPASADYGEGRVVEVPVDAI
jgi:hypothetical protein